MKTKTHQRNNILPSKTLRVDGKTHQLLKVGAIKRGMSMPDYIKMIVNIGLLEETLQLKGAFPNE